MFYCFIMQLDTNLPSILLELSNNQPYAPRGYAGFSDFRVGKVKKVCDINLTYAGYGAFVSKIVCRGRNEGDFGIKRMLFYRIWCRIKYLLCVNPK